MMRTMRAMAKWIMLVVALTFVAWLVFEDISLGGQAIGGPGDVVLRVNGTKIHRQQFSEAYRAAQEEQRLAGAPPIITIEDQRALEDAVAERLIQQALLEQEFRRRGITVSDDELRQWLLNVPPQELREIEQFQTDGQFDLQKYQAFLRSGVDTAFLRMLETQYRQEIPRLKLFERLAADVHVSDAKLWRFYRDQNERVAAKVLVLFPQVVVADADVTLSDADLARYYNANKKKFERPPTAFLSYVAVSRQPNAADSAAALERVRRVRAELVSGADFAEVAERESADSASAARGGDLGEVGRGDFVPEFEEAALALRPGQLSEPVLSPFGYHLIRLESRSGDRYHARHILIPIEPVGEHLRRVDAAADTLDLLAAEQDDPARLDAVAARLGLTVRSAPPVAQGERVELGRFVVPDAHLWAFEAEPGQTSPVIEADPAYYVFRLDSLHPGGVPPLARIRDEVADAVRRDKKWEQARAIAREIADAVRDRMTLDNAALRRGLRTRELEPFTRIQPHPVLQDAPAAVGLAFGLTVGAVGGPVESDLALFFVQPTSRIPADSAAFVQQQQALRQQFLQQARESRLRLILTSLRENAKIEDRRDELFRVRQDEAPPGFLGGY